MKKYKISSLILEVTRLCNMNCKHCLRGPVPKDNNLFIPKNTITKLLQHVEQIDNITFSGGEPSLAVPEIKHTLRMLKQYNIPVYSFYIATNGKVISNDFMDVMDKFYLYCMENLLPNTTNKSSETKYKELRWTEQEFFGGIALSIDDYHDDISIENMIKLKSRSYFREDKMADKNHNLILNRGNAVTLNIDKSQLINRPTENIYCDGNTIETLYMNIHGDLMADCDLPYVEQPYATIGNIHNRHTFDYIESIK